MRVVDSVTLARAVAGAPDAQAAFLREVGPQVASLVRRLGSTGQREDELHEIFAHLLQALPRFKTEGPAKVTTWAFTVAHRFLLMKRRKVNPALVALEGGLTVPDPTAGPEESAHSHQLVGRLEAALAHLSPEQRRAFVLTQLHHQSLEAVAEVEGVPVGTIKSRVHRAKAELVVLMGDALDRAPGGSRGGAKGGSDGVG
jgi:RNA polymerase sigma-70 factor (ECF subfamily)